MSLRVVLIAAMCSIGVIVQGQRERVPAGTKTVVELPQFVDYAPPPSSLGEMVSAATAVVSATYNGARRPSADEDGFVSTAYEFKVNEVVKAEPGRRLAGVVDVYLPGGVVELQDKFVRATTRGSVSPVSGRRYLVFLETDATGTKLHPKWGPWGIYDISEVTAKSLAVGNQQRPPVASESLLREVRSWAAK